MWGSLSEPGCRPSVDRAVGVFLPWEAGAGSEFDPSRPSPLQLPVSLSSSTRCSTISSTGRDGLCRKPQTQSGTPNPRRKERPLTPQRKGEGIGAPSARSWDAQACVLGPEAPPPRPVPQQAVCCSPSTPAGAKEQPSVPF